MNTHFKLFSATKRTLRVGLWVMMTVFCLSGCEKTAENSTASAQKPSLYRETTVLQGSVKNDHGYLEKGTLKVTDRNQHLVASTLLNQRRHYTVEIPANTELPLLLTFYPETPDAKQKPLVVVVIHPSITHYDINPLTTLIAEKALAFGGYTQANLMRAAADSVNVPDSDKTSQGFRGDPTQHYGGWH